MKTLEEKKDALHRFMLFVKREDGPVDFTECWIWTGAHGRGRNGLYPSFSFNGRTVSAHRWSYEYLLGVTIGRGNTLDHRCQRPSCVNPVHIRQLTNKENILASSGPSAENARKSHCKNGHALTQGNVATCKKGWRRCVECLRMRERTRKKGGTET